MRMKNSVLSIIALVLLTLSGCENNYTPLPRGYFRIDLPVHEYSWSDTTFPYYFKVPVYCEIDERLNNPDQKYWVNISYPQYKATIYLSYKPVDGNLIEYLEDSYTLVSKHIPKAEDIVDSIIEDRNRSVYGLTYKIKGTGTASPFQFFVTDSASHFLRGALYFNIVPNNDSLEPVIDFIETDIDTLLNSLKWNDISYSE